MRLPSKITPDRIRDSIVQVFFKTEIPFEPLVGYVFSSLAELGFSYTNQEPESEFKKQRNTAIAPIIPLQHFFSNEEVKILLHPNQSLIFNNIGQYIGWRSYSQVIQGALQSLVDNQVITEFGRVGVRYISEYPNIDMADNIDF